MVAEATMARRPELTLSGLPRPCFNRDHADPGHRQPDRPPGRGLGGKRACGRRAALSRGARGRWRGQAGIVVALRHNRWRGRGSSASPPNARVAVVPYGGGTGLVRRSGDAGRPRPHRAVARTDEPHPGRLSAGEHPRRRGRHDALQRSRPAAEEAAGSFPLSYASEGTATIGGALAVTRAASMSCATATAPRPRARDRGR